MLLRPKLVSLRQILVSLRQNLVLLGPHRNIIFGFRDTDSGSSSGFRLWGGSKSVFLRPNLVFLKQNLEFLRPKLVFLRPNLVFLRPNLAFLGHPKTLDFVSEALILVPAQGFGSGVDQNQCFCCQI